MNNDGREFSRAFDNSIEYAIALLSENENEFAEDIDELYLEPESRDEFIWDLFAAGQVKKVPADFDTIDRADRDLEWTLGLSALAAASLLQTFLEHRDTTIIKPAAYRTQVLSGFDLTRESMIQVAKRGYDVAGTDVFKALQSKYINQYAFLKKMDNVDLYDLLQKYHALKSPDKLISDATAYVTRMTNYASGSVQYKGAISNLVSTSSSRGISAMSRAATRQIHIEEELIKSSGEADPLMIWLVDGGPNSCGFCLDRSGHIQRYSQWLVDGLPGSDVCAGGDLCNCGLMVV
jgi:hypothetical protein